MRVLRHRRHADGSYELAVHVDPAAVLDADHPLVAAGNHEAGDPHPDSVREFAWTSLPPKLDKDGNPTGKPAMSAADYEKMMLREAALLIEAEQASDDEGEPLASEGKKLKSPE